MRVAPSMTGVLMMPRGEMSPQPAPDRIAGMPMFRVHTIVPAVSSIA